MRRGLALCLLVSLVPSAGALLFVRPAQAADPVYDQVGLTAIVSGVGTDGVVGASGGLVTLDTGSAYVNGRLDSSPSSQVLAAPQEPGTLVRTVAGQVNGPAGTTVIDVPDAEARYPGAQTKASYSSTSPVQPGPVVAGPAAVGASTASAQAGPDFTRGSASAASYGIAGALSAGPSTSTLTMTSSVARGTASAIAKTAVSSLQVAGVLTLKDVVATAGVKADHNDHTAVQDLTVGGASVSGQAVVIGNDGVTAVGTPVLPATTLEMATAQANAALSAAGITVHTVGGSMAHTRRSAAADSGGVQITLATPGLPGGIAANRLSITVGGVSLTELDTLFVVPQLSVDVSQPATGGSVGRTTTTTVVPGIPGTPGIPAANAGPPQIAGPVTSATGFVLAGRRISARTALAAFAAWQLVGLGTATLYAFVERRRRLVLMGRPA